MDEFFFTVVTVCYNAETEIEKTVQSVLQQTDTDYEYLVIDGLSSDHTLDIVRKYESQFRDGQLRIISEKDTGIYNAMNKGIDKARGKWIIFMNAGDLFYDGSVLKQVHECITPDDKVICGATHVIKDDYFRVQAPIIATKHNFDMPSYHQSILMRKDVLQHYHFDESYRVCADRDCLTKCWKDGMDFHYVSFIISIFNSDGVSSTNLLQLEKDILRIHVTQKVVFCPEFFKRVFRFPFMAILSWVRNHVSDEFRYKLNKIRYFFVEWKKE